MPSHGLSSYALCSICCSALNAAVRRSGLWTGAVSCGCATANSANAVCHCARIDLAVGN